MLVAIFDRPARRHLLCRQLAGPRSATEPFQWQRQCLELSAIERQDYLVFEHVSGRPQNSSIQGIVLMTGQDCSHFHYQLILVTCNFCSVPLQQLLTVIASL